jgi:hypothetical protein
MKRDKKVLWDEMSFIGIKLCTISIPESFVNRDTKLPSGLSGRQRAC